jgi:dienelactone hydrolase
MRPRLVLLGLGMVIVAPALASAGVVAKRVAYRDGETVLEGILAYDDAIPEGERRPGVAVCHTFWGVNAYTERRARELAGLGYVAFVIDVFGQGTETDDPKLAASRANAAYADLPATRRRAAVGLKMLAEQPRVDPSRLAVIGYCFGGTVALELARSGLPHTENLRAVVAFHAAHLAATGSNEEIATLGRNIKGTVLACHGAADPLVPEGEVETFQKQLEAAGVDYVFVAYAGALHAFTDPGADARNIPTSRYDAEADRRSWRHMRDMFEERIPVNGGGADAQ